MIYAVAGDMFRGSVIDSEYKGTSTIGIMNLVGPDVATIGNHEIGYGLAHLLFLEKCADFPIINANLHIKSNGRRMFRPFWIAHIDDMKILFIGIITEEVLAATKTDELIGSFVDIGEAAREVGNICNAYNAIDIDFTVLLTHIGFEEDKKLAAMLDPDWGVDVIIGGHSHTKLEEQGDYVDVSVRDNGTGIENMDAALTIAARSCAESTLNEHGMGLKHALASINAGEDQHWSIQTRTAEDVANDRYQRAEGPYDIHMPVSMIPGSGEVAGGTGTVVRVRCPMHKFLTLKPASKKEEPTFAQMAAYLRETLRYTYANLLRDKAFTICLTAVDKSGASDGGELAGALEPNWRDGQMTELPPVETDLGGGPVTICCRYGSIRRSKENAFYYRANMASSGAEIRINGRAIQHGLYNEIWGKALHPSQNRFLAQIDILSDQAEALPDTKSAKNGLREDDEKVAALFSWIRANIPEPFKEEGREQMLVRLLAEKKSAEPGVLRVSTEKNLYQCLNLQIKSDLFVSTTEGVTLFEAKAGGSKAEDLYQLRMYHDGCVADDMEVREAVLIAQRHPDTVKALLAELNRQKDKKGRPYHFALTTWDEEGIALPPDAA